MLTRFWKPRLSVRLALLGLALISCGAQRSEFSSSDVPPIARPHLVVFLSDDHGWNDVGYRAGGVVETPNIDTLAAEGVVVDRYYTFPICGPTRVGFMTGRNPIRLDTIQNFQPSAPGLDLDEHLLPESFKAAGYQTWMLGKWHLGGQVDPAYWPQNRGFDHFFGFLEGSTDPYDSSTWQRNGVPFTEGGSSYSADLLADEAVSLIENRDPTKPILLFLAFHSVHNPIVEPPAPSAQKYADLGVTDPNRQILLAMVEAMDMSIGRVLNALDAEGMSDDTLVVFASDNGGAESFGSSNDPLTGEKGDVFEGGVRVPAVVHWPGVLPAGVQSEQLVFVTDWFPTLAAAAGVPALNLRNHDGRDVWQALLNDFNTSESTMAVANGFDETIIRDQWKLVLLGATGDELLYNVFDDPGETTDQAAGNPDIVATLTAELATYAAADGPTAPPRPIPPPGS